ncbi:unnamed protein product [Brassica napus]|uniref:(rape) hypothetical protein n=1 Tax=Brassica napus TaxID=3708 RepID=A0A816JT08_BRANA|nr:unnamed protein product [Brassica napus]
MPLKRHNEKKTDDCLVGSQSPILSQYQLHQHEDSLRSPHHPSPTHQQTDHQSQDHQPPADHDTHNHKSLTCLASTTDDHQTPNTQTPPHCGLPHPSPNHHSSDHHSHDHRSPDHHSPNHHYSDHHSHDHRSPDHHSPDHRSPDQHSHDHQSPDDHSKIPTTLSSHQTPHQQSPLHPSSADHPNVNHQTAIPSESTLLSSDRHSTDHHSPAPQTPEHKTPHHITPNHQTLEHKSSDSNSPTHSPPIHVSTPSSPPTHKPPADAFNLIQGSPLQHYAQIAILPQFDATPLEKPTSLEVMSGSDPATISAPFKPAGTTTPNSTPTKPAVSPQAFSPHSSSPNAFAALKGSTNTFLSTPNHQTGKEVDKEDTDSGSPDTKHMIVLMHVLGERHKSVLLMHNSAFTTPELTSLMLSKDRQFQAAVRKDRLRWDTRLTKLIMAPRLTWMKEVHTVYTSMIWADKHWVGLAINLAIGHVEVMDSQPTMYDDGEVLNFMKPILQMLPYLVRYVAKNNARGLSPFTWERIPSTYKNIRSGDCGPVCVKFMEMHPHENPYSHMSGITDAMVDQFHRIYAMDAYKTIVIPAYQSTTTG